MTTNKSNSLFESKQVKEALAQSFVKLNPKMMIKNPVMFTVETQTANIMAVPISTVNITGFLIIIFGFSFTKDCTKASFTCLLSNNDVDLLVVIFILFCLTK